MKDFLYFLFYHLIVYVNTAIILSIIIRFAKRKDEKDEKKPSGTVETVIYPRTNGKTLYAEMLKRAQKEAKPILTSAIVLAEDGKIVIPPEESGTPVSGYGDGKIYGYVQTLAPDDGNDDGKAYSINPRTGEVEGYPAIDGTVYRVYFWTSGKAVQAAHVRPQSGREKFEAAFEALQYAEDRVHGLRKNERILIDDAEKVIEEALAAYFHTPVDAITINRPNVLKSRLDEEQREIAKDANPEAYAEEFAT